MNITFGPRMASLNIQSNDSRTLELSWRSMVRWRGQRLVLALPLALLACADFPRYTETRTIRSEALRDVWSDYSVFVPSSANSDERLPLVLFLHGGGDGPDCFDRHGVSRALQDAMTEERVPRAIIVIPQGDLGFWANWYDGSRNYEDWAVDEVLAAVARDYPTRACPDGCHIMGVSMGAEGAVRIALHRPGTFASITSISGPSLDTDRRIEFANDRLLNIIVPTRHIFGPPEPRSRVERDDPFVQWRSEADLRGSSLYLAWGTEDRGEVQRGGEALDAYLNERSIPHVSYVYEGGHNWHSWIGVIEEALRAQLGSP